MEVLNFEDIKDIYIEVLILDWEIRIINNQWVLKSNSGIIWTLKDGAWTSNEGRMRWRLE